MLGDVDGDGTADLVVLEDAHTAYFFTHLATNAVEVVSDALATVSLGDGSYAFAVTNLGDLDADGRAETLLPAAIYGSSGESYAAIWPGSSVVFGAASVVTDAGLTAVSIRARSEYGFDAALSDDVDGDGVPDILLGAPAEPEGGDSAGAVQPIALPR